MKYIIVTPTQRREDEEGNAPWDRYNREDPSVGAKQLTTGYRKWAERYISQCSGQRLYSHQVNFRTSWFLCSMSMY